LNHPSSLNIVNLVVGAPTDSRNTLMLNFAGREWPLRVAREFHVRWNSVFLTLDSGLQVGTDFHIDGTAIHTDFSEVSASSMQLGTIFLGGQADYNLTNGTLTVTNNLLIGPDNFGMFRQYGGANRARELRLGNGEYQLYGGDVGVHTLKIGGRSSLFYHNGGDVSVTNAVLIGENDGTILSVYNIWGRYIMSNGTLRTASLRVGTPSNPFGGWGGEGMFIQSGGTNLTTTLHVGAGGQSNSLRVTYELQGGLLHTSTTTVGPGFDVAFSQSGGLHIVDGPVNIQGGFVHDASVQSFGTHYGLSGGTLRSPSVNVSNALFFHIDGTNDVAGDLLLDGATDNYTEYLLLNGRLATSNTIVRAGPPWAFRHEGGVHQVRKLLDLSGRPGWGSSFIICEFNGGQIIAPDIRIRDGIFGHVGGTISNSGSVTLADGHWEEVSPGTTQLGALRLDAGSNDSRISFHANNITLRFLPSAGAPWAANAKLLVEYWRGSTNGGGTHRLIFGSSNTGLSAQQVRQIRFHDPAGYLSGTYPARILSTGEVVPAPPPSLAWTRNGHSLLVQWPAGYTLQTATNISGPFTDINQASPYEIQTGTDPQRYFRLRP